MPLPFPIHSSISGDGLPGELAEAASRAGVARFVEYAGDPAIAASGPRVAMIGTRHPSMESTAAFEGLAAQLAAAGAVIVSGCAEGCDMAAHRGALSVGGRTVGALPCGLGTIQWHRWRSDFAQLRNPDLLLLLSPFPRRQPITRQTPIIRNRLIAALAEVVVVGEAGVGSGTHHCLRFARQLGVPVFFQQAEGEDVALAMLHRNLRQSGAMGFTHEEAFGARLPADVLRAAAARRAQEKDAGKAQLKLFDT